MKHDGLPNYDRRVCLAKYLLSEAEYIVARDRYMESGADYLQYILAKGEVERAGGDYLYSIRCEQSKGE
jgi:hypothetical protein